MMTNESALAAAHLYAKREELLNHVLGIVRGDGVILVTPVEGGPSRLMIRDDWLRINAEFATLLIEDYRAEIEGVNAELAALGANPTFDISPLDNFVFD
jgi:hypothetical protein